ncbi:MAG: hypothetical protein JO040_03185 [Gemmatimonadetes bacterium]|nr:hypothetical protein [Gemmatimonadota bacterium]
MQVSQLVGMQDGQPVTTWSQWARGIPQTNEGDFKMVTEWWRLGFVRRTPGAPLPGLQNVTPPADPPPYVSVETTPHSSEDQ